MSRALRILGLVLWATVAGGAAPPPAGAPAPGGAPAASGSAALEQLRANVQYWEERGRADKAVEVWRKILRSDPRDADALAALALEGARRGRTDEARTYLGRLEAEHPGHPKIASVRQALGLGAQYAPLLAEARRLVAGGKAAEGVAAYRRLFGEEAPSGAVGLEFYTTLGGLPEGWEEARAGLARLAADNPSSARFALAHARHLTYREETRRDGIARLSELAGAGDVGAVKAWGQALGWLEAAAADAPLFRAYLAKVPGDAAIKARLATLEAAGAPRPVDVRGERLSAAYAALEQKDAALAEQVFKRLLEARQTDVDALVGLASVALAREDFAAARELLTRVKRLAPKQRELWERSLASAEFWGDVQLAKAAAAAGKVEEAEAALARAVKRAPEHADEARLILAGVYAQAGRGAQAEALLREVLGREPEHTGALRALVDVYMALEEADKALEVNDRLSALAADKAMDGEEIRAEVLRRQAKAKRAAGEVAAARALLDAAHAKAPKNRRVAFDLAYAVLESGEVAEARRLADALRADAPAGELDAPRLVVWVLTAEERYGDALSAVRALPKEALGPPLVALARKLEVQAETLAAVKQAQRGKPLAAQHRLTELQRRFGAEPELLALVALAWADLKDFDRAQQLMLDALAATPDESSTLKLQLAAVLHRAGREAELLQVLRELSADSGLSAPERRGLVDLQLAYTVRQADIARERGALSMAYSILAVPLKEHPDDARILSALGRIFVSAGEYAEAAALFTRVLEAHPDNIEAREGAIRAAVETGREAVAARLRDEGFTLAPSEPRMHLAAARMAVLLGEDGEAMDHYERALALELGQSAAADGGGAGAMNKVFLAAADRFGAQADGGSRANVALSEEIGREMDALRARHTVRVSTGFATRVRDGEAGLGRVLSLGMPTTLSIPAGYKARLTFAVSPLALLAGTLDLDEPRPATLFGTSGVDPAIAAGDYAQSASGVALSATLEAGVLRLMAGASPLGFPRQTAVGELSWRDRFGPVGLSLEAYRRPVTDSLVSYAGARDVLTGVVWGGVTDNGGRFDLGIIADEVRFYLVARGGLFLGANVPTNWMGLGALGLDWRLYDWGGTSVTTGLGATAFVFDQNLRHFTFGHGGYFSPQRFANVAIPFRWSHDGARVRYGLSVHLGVNGFEEEAAPFYPTDPARQAARAELLDPDTDEPLGAWHVGQTSFAFAFDASGRLAFELGDAFEVGLELDLHTGHDFVEFTGGLSLGYLFDRKVQAAREPFAPAGGL